MLNITIEHSEENVILRCAGQIVRGFETGLLCAAIGQSDQELMVDLSQVDAIDGAGVGALVALQGAGIYLRMLNPAEAIREVLRLSGVDSLFEIIMSPALTGDEKSPMLLSPGFAA